MRDSIRDTGRDMVRDMIRDMVRDMVRDNAALPSPSRCRIVADLSSLLNKSATANLLLRLLLVC